MNLLMRRETIARQQPPTAYDGVDSAEVNRASQDQLYEALAVYRVSVRFFKVDTERTHEASTMSLPHGEMEAEPTGLSKRNDTS